MSLLQKPKKGSRVHYVCKIDSDADETPNVWPAIVTKVQKDGTADLWVMTSGGFFVAGKVNHDEHKTRGTWHWTD
jgi:hypothetical protein